LNLLNNKIGDEGESPSVQYNINTHNDPQYSIRIGSMGIPTETSKAIARAKTFVVWKLFDKDVANDKATCKICKAVYAHKKGGGMRTSDRDMKRSHKN
jgi:hypothetical protein